MSTFDEGLEKIESQQKKPKHKQQQQIKVMNALSRVSKLCIK
jgi:hypothetical protein